MRNFPTNFLLLIICCLWCHVQPTAGVNYNTCLSHARNSCRGQGADYYWWCLPRALHPCAAGNNKRSDINDLTQDADLRAEGEEPELQGTRGGERNGGGRESDPSGGDRSDEPRSEISDLRQLLEEKQLLDIANRQQSPSFAPSDSTLGRLKSLLKKTAPQVDDREVKEKEGGEEEGKDEEEPPRRNITDTDRRNSLRDTLKMLGKILTDIGSKLDSPKVSDSESKKRGQADDAENDF